MSDHDTPPPDCTGEQPCPGVDLVLTGRESDIGGLIVRRLLPYRRQRNVGPFVFLDHMGPAHFEIGGAMQVKPHPHIGLATVTYLYEGAIVHRDSIGIEETIEPGAINLMIAGRGITHSERTTPDVHHLHGLQFWLALPKHMEACNPGFVHAPGDELPLIPTPGVEVRVLIGEAFGESSSVPAIGGALLLDILMEPDASITLPDAPERALYIATGGVRVNGQDFGAHQLLVLRPDVPVKVESGAEGARVALLGGDPLDGPRLMFWNFVASEPGLIEQAKADWKAGHFPKVFGDTEEFVPLPE